MNPIFRCSIGNRSFRCPDLTFRGQRAERRSRRAGGPRAIARLVLDRREHAGTLGQIKEKPDPALDRQHGIYLQDLMNYPIVSAGLVMGPRGLGTMGAMMAVGKLIGRVDTRYLLGTGLALTAWAFYVMTGWTPDISQ